MKKILAALFVLIPGTAHADVLPKPVLGAWASDPKACGEQASELGLRVEPKYVLFYEHGYEVRKVVRLKDGSLKASGYSANDEGRVRGSVTLKLLAPDKLQVGDTIYARCRTNQ